MAEVTPITKPHYFEGGHADFLLRSDMLKNSPAAYRAWVQMNNEPVTFLEILNSLGLSSMVSKAHDNPYADFYFKEDDERFFAISSATAQTDAGDTVTVTLAATEMGTKEGRKVSRPRKMEVVQDKNGKNWKITNKITNTGSNPHQLVLTPNDATTVGTFTANDRFFILGPTGAEATGQPKGLVSDYGQYSNRFVIAKETDLTSGTNMTTNVGKLMPIKGTSYQYIDGIAEAEARHERNKSAIAVHGQLGDNIFDYSPDFDTDVLDHNTEGLIQSIQRQGTEMTWNGSSNAVLDVADYRRVEAKFRQLRLNTSDILNIQGGSAASDAQAALETYLGKEVNVKYFADKYMGGKYKSGERFTPQDHFIQLGFNGISFGNYKFIFREASELNGLYGDNYAGGIDYSNWQFFIPLTQVTDVKRKANIPALQLLHRGQTLGGYQRQNEVWKTGGAGPIQKTDEWDVMRHYIRSEFCLQLIAGKFSIILKKGTADS